MLLPHRLELRSSRLLAAALALPHMAALLSLLPLQLSPWLELTLATAIASSGIVSLRRHALRVDGASVRELILKTDGAIEGTRNDGSRFDARASQHSTVWPWLVVILLERQPGSMRVLPLIILPDALPSEELRILRAWLRWKLS